MKTQNNNWETTSFDAETAYKVVSKVIWHFCSGVSTQLIKKWEVPDLIQDAMLRAYSFRYSFNPEAGKFSAWIGTVAYRYACDVYEKRRRRYVEMIEVNQDWNMTDKNNTPEMVALNEEFEDKMRMFLESLQGSDRECFNMMADGNKPREIAKKLGCTANAARARLCRIRKNYEKYEKECE